MLYTDLNTVNDSDASPEPSGKKVLPPKAPRKSSKKVRVAEEKTPTKVSKKNAEDTVLLIADESKPVVPKAKKQKYKPAEDEVPPKWFINYVKFKQEKKVAAETEEKLKKRKAEEEKQLKRQEELQKRLLELQAKATENRAPTPQNSPVNKVVNQKGLSSIFANRPR